ncbi:nucleoside deaminase [Sulfurovum sp. zt1-1]|uniref:Nucleoside deaminase n=1 Tax=Sulfurovum zhangzhouensis TaxID=3019067 RepID=A0ABT7QV42_9BACT|nr:nucleoside deaminase [Sulfurovum zhangzhouensis]MDM5270710.1 nucleoside deaminase [Sulfurovum zhangzhouensis]
MYTEDHEKFIKRCIELAQEALDTGDNPFGSVVVKDNEIIAEARNSSLHDDITDHAEIIAMRKAKQVLGTSDLSGCILYSNCEPCPMCSFMMREQKIKEVVFALRTPHMGGYSRWDILQDEGLTRYAPVFSTPPNIIAGVLEKEAAEQFEKAGWTIHKI